MSRSTMLSKRKTEVNYQTILARKYQIIPLLKVFNYLGKLLANFCSSREAKKREISIKSPQNDELSPEQADPLCIGNGLIYNFAT